MNQNLACLLYGVMFTLIGILILGTVSKWGDSTFSTLLLFFPLAFIVIIFNFSNSWGLGANVDITFDSSRNQIIIGQQSIPLSETKVSYYSTSYHNPLSRSWHNGDVMAIIIENGALATDLLHELISLQS